MPEPTRLLSPDRPAAPVVYRPLSGTALAGFLLAAGYAVTVSLFGLLAFFSGAPLLLPVWTVMVPVLAAGLAFIGRLRIRRSEDTLAGGNLAAWALRLSAIFGFGYIAFYVGMRLAVTWQAESFTQAFFKKLQEGKVNAAFLDTVDPATRKSANPDNPKDMGRFLIFGPENRKGGLVLFEENELVRQVRYGGPNVATVAQGVTNYDYKGGGYEVVQTYLLTTAEGTFEVKVTVHSKESREFTGRQWQIIWGNNTEIVDHPYKSQQGLVMISWRMPAHAFVDEWIAQRDGGVYRGYLETCEPRRRPALAAAVPNRLLLATLAFCPAGGGPAAGLAKLGPIYDPEVGMKLFVPDFTEYAAGALVNSKKFVGGSEEVPPEEIAARVKKAFLDPQMLGMNTSEKPEDTRPEMVDGSQVRMYQDVTFALAPARPGSPKYIIDAVVVIESDPGPLAPTRKPNWRLARIDLQRCTSAGNQQGPLSERMRTSPGKFGPQ